MKSIWLIYHDIYDGDPTVKVPRTAAIYHVSKENFFRHLSAIKDSGRRVVTVGEFLKGHGSDSVVLTFDDGWKGAFEIGLPLLQKFGWKATFFLTADFVGRKGFCTQDMILEAAKANIEIGVHGTKHRMLSACSPETMSLEFATCKKFLESLLNKPVEFASLPGGDGNGRIASCAKNAGIKALCTSRPGINHTGTSPFDLRRVAVRASTRDSDIRRYCHYHLSKELVRWALLHAPRRLVGIENYARFRRWFLDEEERETHELFSR